MSEKLKILFKYPSRNRKDRFFNSLDSLYNNLYDGQNFRVAITLDDDDEVMNHPDVVERIENNYPNHIITFGKSDNKVHAINRDLPDYGDIIVVMSDDFFFTFYGFDEVIRSCFKETLDCMVHLPDQDEKDKIATMYIAGRPFYNRFGWIYNPCYKSLFCDTELQEVAKKLELYKFFNYPGVIWHALPAYGHLPADQQWLDQQELGWDVDQKTYLERQANNFYL